MKTTCQLLRQWPWARTLLLLGLLLLGRLARAQNLTRLEYFYDADPGYGQGTAVVFPAAAPSQDYTYVASLAGLASGFHTLYTRVLAPQVGRRAWSLPLVHPLYVGAIGAARPSLTRLEYFYDADPGYGRGHGVALAPPGPTADRTYAADLSGLAPGFHTLYTRVRDAAGAWSLLQVHPLYLGAAGSSTPSLTYAEYFVDADPGYGRATRVSFAAPGPGVSQAFTADLSAVPNGFHTLFVRVRDAAGAWSLSQVRPFVRAGVTAGAAPPALTRCEYYLDADPGYGHGTAVPLTSGPVVNQAFTADLSAVPNGFHTLFVRVRDAAGTWSLVSVRPFVREGSGAGAVRPALTGVRYQLFKAGTVAPVGPPQVYALPPGTPAADLDATFTATPAVPTSGNYVLRVAALTAAGIPSVEYAHAFFAEASAPLPVELVAFSATRRGPDVLAEWRTASERGSAYFALEATPDPSAGFAEVGRVPAAGSSATARRYALTEAGVPATGTLRYYRLRQVDLDGTLHYSPTRAVLLDGPAAELSLQAQPNPFRHHELQVTIAAAQAGPATLQVIDLLGRAVLSRVLILPAGPTTLVLPELTALPAGAYLLALCQGPQRRQFKLLKE